MKVYFIRYLISNNTYNCIFEILLNLHINYAFFILNKTMAITINTSLRISAVGWYKKINEEGEGKKEGK